MFTGAECSQRARGNILARRQNKYRRRLSDKRTAWPTGDFATTAAAREIARRCRLFGAPRDQGDMIRRCSPVMPTFLGSRTAYTRYDQLEAAGRRQMLITITDDMISAHSQNSDITSRRRLLLTTRRRRPAAEARSTGRGGRSHAARLASGMPSAPLTLNSFSHVPRYCFFGLPIPAMQAFSMRDDCISALRRRLAGSGAQTHIVAGRRR